MIPINYKKIRSVVVSGSNAFIPLLPYPKIRVEGNHAYVLPSECIRLFLARGYIPTDFNNTENKEVYEDLELTP